MNSLADARWVTHGTLSTFHKAAETTSHDVRQGSDKNTCSMRSFVQAIVPDKAYTGYC